MSSSSSSSSYSSSYLTSLLRFSIGSIAGAVLAWYFFTGTWAIVPILVIILGWRIGEWIWGMMGYMDLQPPMKPIHRNMSLYPTWGGNGYNLDPVYPIHKVRNVSPSGYVAPFA